MPSSPSSSSGGPLVKVAFARNEPEAELIQGLLLESGIPSVLKRSRGFDVPDFLAAGPRDVFVEQAVVEKARRLLADTVLETEEEERAEIEGAGRPAGAETSPARLAFWLLTALLGAVALVWVLYQLS
jgi:Putative prokaryotic signal transducing protein